MMRPAAEWSPHQPPMRCMSAASSSGVMCDHASSLPAISIMYFTRRAPRAVRFHSLVTTSGEARDRHQYRLCTGGVMSEHESETEPQAGLEGADAAALGTS